jgi:mRNA interferase MazF
VGLALVCPVTSRAKGYPFEVRLPDGLEVQGVILADQVRSLDWRARDATLITAVPQETIDEVLAKLRTLTDDADTVGPRPIR